MMSNKIGETYISPCQLLFVVVEATQIGVVALVLSDREGAKAPMMPGTLMNIFTSCAFWDEAVPFASLPEGDTLSP